MKWQFFNCRRSARSLARESNRLGEVDAGNLNVRVALRETAGIEAGATGYFKKVGFRTRPGAGPKRVGDCCGVIAEEMFTTECVEP